MLFELAFAGSLVFFIVAERVCSAIGTLLSRLIFGTSGTSSVKGYAGVQVLGGFISFLFTVAGSIVDAVLSAVGGLMGYAVWAVTVALFFSVIYVVQEYYPDVLLGTVQYWNDSIGPTVDMFVFVPLRTAEIVSKICACAN